MLMFKYQDEEGQEVVFIREKCTCSLNRDHVFQWRVNKFCFLWTNITWLKGLQLVVFVTIFFLLLKVALVTGIIYWWTPSDLEIFFLYPHFSLINLCQIITFFGFSVLLQVGVRCGNLKLIKLFPWGIMLNYVFQLIFLTHIIINGESMIEAIAWAKYGMLIKSQEKRRNIYFKERLLFYLTMFPLEGFDVAFTTYIIILSLSCIDALQMELDKEDMCKCVHPLH